MTSENTILSFTINERIYKFECSPESPLGEAFDAICKFQSFISERINEETKKLKNQRLNNEEINE